MVWALLPGGALFCWESSAWGRTSRERCGAVLLADLRHGVGWPRSMIKVGLFGLLLMAGQRMHAVVVFADSNRLAYTARHNFAGWYQSGAQASDGLVRRRASHSPKRRFAANTDFEPPAFPFARSLGVFGSGMRKEVRNDSVSPSKLARARRHPAHGSVA